ncbi:Fic family protein [Kribbella solani]|uniref:Fic/DOC family protein n=1 Tax=Kribbella solani TaxID=236067 RepID=UPI0029BBD111|nr:Fic family protein [Kribbella solani]MDX2969072.1 Fic family protein [Kribbella solani]MDX3001358.1 Fic family protein [Kribbella solani]
MAEDPYLYPGTETLRNKFGERDKDVLKGLDYAAAMRAQEKLESGETDVPRTYDAQHLHAIHKQLFQDVYEWAGQPRPDVTVVKGVPGGFAPPNLIDRYLTDAAEAISSADWASMDQEQFAQQAAKVFAYVNQAHPYREGNGRATKLFMQHVSELSPYELDYTRIPDKVWNQRSMLSGPDIGQYEPVPEMMQPVFEVLAKERPDGPARTMLSPELQKARQAAGLDPGEVAGRNANPQSSTGAGTDKPKTSRGRGTQSPERG